MRGPAAARVVFDRAVTEVGLDITGGVAVWAAFRHLELHVLDEQPTSTEQLDRVTQLYVRELSQPLAKMESVHAEFIKFCAAHGRDASIVMNAYSRAHDALLEREDFEYKTAGSPSLIPRRRSRSTC
jgi:hypothetical protein